MQLIIIGRLSVDCDFYISRMGQKLNLSHIVIAFQQPHPVKSLFPFKKNLMFSKLFMAITLIMEVQPYVLPCFNL